jgi:hypothetical protein
MEIVGKGGIPTIGAVGSTCHTGEEAKTC